jgi:acyl-coenzyme A synthetase/AMP-(fatty) acid ligase
MRRHRGYSHLVRSLDLSELVSLVAGAKTHLIQRGVAPGDQVLLIHTVWPQYLAWFLACAELGLVLVVSDEHLDSAYVSDLLHRCYGDIRWVIADQNQNWQLQHHTAELISSVISGAHTSSADQIWSTPQSVLIRASTSGTTGWPTVTDFTHAELMSLAYRNAQVLGFQGWHRCLHTKILHHGSVVAVHFLPALLSCDQHWHLPELPEVPRHLMARLIQTENIQQVLCFYQQFSDLAEHLDPDILMPDLHINVLSGVHTSELQRVTKLGAEVRSIYGTTQSSGPVFAPVIQPGWSGVNFGAPLDDFYQIRISADSELCVTPGSGTEVRTGDNFSLDQNSDYIWAGRNTQYRRAGTRIFLSEILSALRVFLPDISTDAVYNPVTEQIYLRSDQPLDLNTLNQQFRNYFGTDNYQLDLVVVAHRSEFFSGIKFNSRYFLNYCEKLPENPGNYQIISVNIC